jgi:DNA-binding NarL/FixJ family response regulator
VADQVLIVDDELEILDLLEIWFSDDPRCGAVKRADNLDQAVEIARAWRPNVIVLDFFLRDRTCVEGLPELRLLCPGARIVVHTASRRSAEAAGATAAGADAVIEKNHYTIDALIDRLLDGADGNSQEGQATG